MPRALVNAIDSPAVRWFLKAFKKSGGLSLNLLQRTAATILRGMARITGGGFLEQVASFLNEVNELFGDWQGRAEEVSTALRGPGVGYVLVTTPEPMAIREVLFFAERLRRQGMSADAYVVNRMHQNHPHIDEAAIALAIERRGLDLGEDGSRRVVEAVRRARRLGELNRLHLVALEEVWSDGEGPPIVHVPDFPLDIHDVTRLAWVADVIAPNGG